MLRKRRVLRVPNSILILLLFLFLPLFSGCVGFLGSKATITLPDGKKYIITGKSDALVELTQKDGTTLKMDNRGRPGLFEQLLGVILMRAPDVTIEKND